MSACLGLFTKVNRGEPNECNGDSKMTDKVVEFSLALVSEQPWARRFIRFKLLLKPQIPLDAVMSQTHVCKLMVDDESKRIEKYHFRALYQHRALHAFEWKRSVGGHYRQLDWQTGSFRLSDGHVDAHCPFQQVTRSIKILLRNPIPTFQRLPSALCVEGAKRCVICITVCPQATLTSHGDSNVFPPGKRMKANSF